MLILSRKLKESIRIGDGVVIHVLGIRGGRVKLGIEAPDDIGVVRDELQSRSDSRNGGRAPAKRTS